MTSRSAAVRRLGPYEFTGRLGAGGMGEVYRARDTRLGRDVAIKVLPAEVASHAGRLKRFEKEARSASALNHPNIVTIYEIGSHDSVSYIAMELVEGKTLRELIASGPPPVRRTLAIAAQLADGLARAHEAGFVHRDLKPENVMVTKDGLVKILDFGLAKLARPDQDGGELTQGPTVSAGTSPGVVMGTVGYMSPEQASGHPVDLRSDQFSLGSVLYEMATGKPPFRRGTAAQTLAAIIQEEPEPIATANPTIAVSLRWIVERCLAKDPNERFASTRDLARDLAMLRDHISEVGGVDRTPAASRARGWVFVTVAGALIFVASVAYRTGKAVSPAPPSFHQLTHRRGFVTAARFAPGDTVVYSAAWEDIPIEIFSIRIGQPETRPLGFPGANLLALSRTGELALGLSAKAVVFDGAIRLPGIWNGTLARAPLSGGAPRELEERVRFADWWESKILAVRRTDGKSSLEFPGGPVIRATEWGLRYPRVSPQNDLAAFTEINGSDMTSLFVTDRDGRARALTRDWSEVSGMAWRSGKELWFWGKRSDGDPGLFAVNLSGKLRLVARWPGSWVLMDIAPDGRLLAARLARRTALLAMAPGEEHERDLSWFDSSRLVDISADGRTILFEEKGSSTDGKPVAFLRGMDGSSPVRLGEGDPRALSGDSEWAFLQPEPSSGFVAVPTRAGARISLARGDIVDWSFASGFPDGGRVAFAGRDRQGRDRVYVQSVDGEPRPIGEEGFGRPFVSPDGRQIEISRHRGDGTSIRIYSSDAISDAAPIRELEVSDNVEPSGWSADGKRLLLRRGGPDQSVVPVEWLNLATGRRELLREFRVADPAGVLAGIGYILVAPHGKSYAYSVTRDFSDLYVVEHVQ